MREFDYSFLQHLPLPTNISSLLTSIDSLCAVLSQSDGRRTVQYTETLSSEFAETNWSSLSAETILRIAGCKYMEDKQPQIDAVVSAYFAAVDNGAPPLLAVPCLVMDICCLSHSGRIDGAAITLAQLLLCRSGMEMCRYCSLTDTIYKHIYFFSRALSRASIHWDEGGNEYLIFIEQFLSLLYLSLKAITPQKKRKSPPAGQKPTKRARIETLVLGSTEPISKADICAKLPDISPTTIEAALGTLVRAGVVQRIGAARASKYIRA